MAGPNTGSALPIDLASLVEAFTSQSAEKAAALTNLQTTGDEYRAASESEAQAVINEAQLHGAIKGSVDQLALDRSRRNKEAAAFFGVNPEASNSIIQEMSQNIAARHTELVQEADQINQRMSASFADDPINWIVEQFKLPSDVAAHNAKVGVMEAEMSYLEKMGELADKQIARNNAIEANTTLAISRQESERLLQVAQARVSQIRAEAAKFGVQLGTIRLSVTQQDFQNQIRIFDAGVQMQHLQLAQASKELQREQTELQRRNLELLVQKKESDENARNEFQANLDRATTVLGMRKITVQEYDRAPTNVKAALYDAMANPSINEGRLGYNVVDALDNANNTNAPLTPQLTEVKRALNTWVTEAASANPTWAALKPAQQKEVAQKYIEDKIKRESMNIPDQGGMFSPPSLRSVGQIPAVNSTILWKSTFAPQAASSVNRPTSAQAIFDAGVSLVADNKMDLDRAANEISTIYKAIHIDNVQQRDYNRFAIPIPKGFTTILRPGDQFVGSKGVAIDMTNETAVRAALLRGINAAKQGNEASGYPIFGTPGVK